MAKTVTFDVIARSKATGFDDTNRKLEDQQKQLKLLSTSVVALGPALVPISAAAVSAGASLAALGVTGVLAFGGIRKEMANGTPIGKAYSGSIDTLKGNLDELEHSAAKGVLTGFQKSVAELQPLMPTVNNDTAQLSSVLGDIGSHVMPGVVRLFTTANPLFLDFANDLDKGAVGFEHWTQSSTGAQKFVDYARAELPKVEDTVLSLATTAGHLVQGIAPLGGTSLAAVTAFSKVINAIPIGVLQAAAPAIAGLKVAGTVSALVDKLGNSFEDASVKAKAFNAGTAGIGTSVGVIGTVLGAGYLITQQYGKQLDILANQFATGRIMAAGNASQLDDLKTTYQEVTGATATSNKTLLDFAVSSRNVGQAASSFSGDVKDLVGHLGNLGVSSNQVKAAVGGSDATFAAFVTRLQSTGKVSKDEFDTLNDLHSAFGDLIVSTAEAGSTAAAATSPVTGLTSTMQSQVSQVMAASTQIGFLNAELDKLSNFALDAEQQELKLRDSFAGAAQALKGNGSALDDNTAKGRANKEWLLTQIQAINSHVSAVGKQTGSVKAATSALASDEAGLRRAAAAAGLNKGQVDALIRSYAATPKQVETAVKADTSQALGKISGVQAALNNLQSYKVLQIVEVTSKINAGSAGTNLNQRASGGSVLAHHKYLVNEAGEELYVTGSGAYMLRGGPHMWTAPATGQIINAATVKGLKTKAGAVASASLTQLPGAASSAISAVAKVLPYGSPITKALQKEDKELQVLVAKRADLAKKMTAANSQLAGEQQQYNQIKSGVQSAFLGSFNIGTAGRDVFGNVTAGGIVSDLRTTSQRAGLALSDINKLSGKVDKGLLQQLAGEGVDALPTLQALTGATPAQLRDINTLEARLGSYGARAGSTIANNLVGSQIKATQALIKSIAAQQKATDRLEQRLQSVLARGLNITIQGGDARTIVRELDRYFAGTAWRK